MDETRFWQIIQQSYDACGGNVEEQADTLRALLGPLPPAEVQQFEIQFARRFFEAYSYDLWGAIWLIEGGCGDDSFMDFRYWLISRGEATFRQVLADPESLVDEPGRLDQSDLFFEEFGSVASVVFREKTREELKPELEGRIREPTGENFDVNVSTQMQARWPRIFASYGDD